MQCDPGGTEGGVREKVAGTFPQDDGKVLKSGCFRSYHWRLECLGKVHDGGRTLFACTGKLGEVVPKR